MHDKVENSGEDEEGEEKICCRSLGWPGIVKKAANEKEKR